ncbi:hydrogenase formation protein HypD [Hyalangium minutum]|uniref:[NiFe] hydrogenase metallocenter assembly protein HypD n=1 Tax=Hyalangium minutum TaxID=394096 RepID=A0A085WHA5_9BACT|nr:hydrogenase formation protein HypD [Hyalangium minutum]KFE67068.1 [NiFe] hydrogenase metallocenter assembly protein HypD [Hyalangium minutum]
MRYVEEYRGAEEAHRFVQALHARVTRPWTLMEICGGQTHAIVRFGIDQLLPPGLTLLHGPGCPVCVTSVETLDKALAIASRPGVVFCSFGDMLRVPGSERDLLSVKAAGADVRIVYSPMDALALAERLPGREVVFFAVGFETTAPASAMAVHEARRRGLRNFSLLAAHVLVPPAMEAILADRNRRVDGFLAAGHVCTIMGMEAYGPLARAYRVPIVVTGFEPLDLLQGIHMCVAQLEDGRAAVENQYARAVRPPGNAPAQAMLQAVFEVVHRTWRGIGPIPSSGLGLRAAYADWDAERKFGVSAVGGREDAECRSGSVLRGLLKPPECPAFGTRCTPETPLGATMVSSEGACAAYYRYRRFTGP